MRSLDRCDHLFCLDCLESHIKERLSKSQAVPCPAEGCEGSLTEASPIYDELQGNTQKMLKKREALSFILQNPGYQLCKKEECEGKFKQSKGEKGNKCDVCATPHCRKCFEVFHVGLCSEKMAAFLEGNAFFRRCKRCRFIVEKNEGCNHITCLCGYSFCYACG